MSHHYGRRKEIQQAGVVVAPAVSFGQGDATERGDTTAGDVLRQAKALLQAWLIARATTAEQVEAERREGALEAEVLLAHVLSLSRTQLLTRPDRVLGSSELRRYQELIDRRLQGEPVSYITGHREFFGLDFAVDPRVLVPRPETELLVELAIAEGRRLGESGVAIADVGTGSGAIAISLATALPEAKVYAIDISADALDIAAANCLRHGVAGRVALLHGDLLSPLPVAVDIIVANLPYVAPEDLPMLPAEVVQHEPTVALLAKDGGLALYRQLLSQARAYLLREGAAIIMEISPTQTAAITALITAALRGAEITVIKDYAGLDRVALARIPDEH